LKVRRFRDLFVLRATQDDGIVVRLRATRSGAQLGGSMKRQATSAKPDETFEYGVHLNVLGRALITQADERIAWHRQMAETMTAELSAAERPDATASTDWRQQARRTELERKISSHLEYARFLTFVRQNLERNRRYRLSLADLTTLEISPKGLYL
jgi:hypothetical protein